MPMLSARRLQWIPAVLLGCFIWLLLGPILVKRMDLTFSWLQYPIPDAAAKGKNGDFDPLNFVNGNGMRSLHDNLRNDTRYVTAFSDGGFTNEFINGVHIICLAMLSERVPILPPHSAVHVGPALEVGILHFGDIWDLVGLRETLRYPAIEWRDVKELDVPVASRHELDVLGCWTVRSAWDRNGNPIKGRLPDLLRLDLSHTPLPDFTKLENRHNSFAAVASLGFPSGREEGLAKAHDVHNKPIPFPSEVHKAAVWPDDHLMCLDTGYYLAGVGAYEWDRDYSFAWRLVGRHVRWNERMVDMTRRYLRQLWEVEEGDEIPQFVAIHLRRADFATQCHGTPIQECFPPLAIIFQHVEMIRATLDKRHPPVSAVRVLMTSDETDTTFWADVRRRGWSSFDWTAPDPSFEILDDGIHQAWRPTLVDAVSQSMAVGFVGTAGSTMSLLALKRVQEWNGGAGVLISHGPGMYSQEWSSGNAETGSE